MKTLPVLLLLVSPFLIKAQFINHPLPLKGADFALIHQEKITTCTVNRLLDMGNGEKISQPVLAVEYGYLGMPAVLYEIATDEYDAEILDTIAVTYYKFDNKNRLWTEKRAEVEYDGFNALYTYNKKGQLVKKEVAVIDPPTYAYLYDKKGLLTEIYVTLKMPAYDENGDFTNKTIDYPAYRYLIKNNDKGQIVSMTGYMLGGEKGPGELNGLKEWLYDDKGRVINIRQYQTDAETLDVETTYHYDEKGLLSSYEEKWEDETWYYNLVYCRDCIQSWMK